MMQIKLNRKGDWMARSKVSETHSISAEGLVGIEEDGLITLDVEDMGLISLAELLKSFNGTYVKMRVTLNNEIE